MHAIAKQNPNGPIIYIRALEAYESDGGTISTAIEYETRATVPSVTEQNLENGDTEISLEFND